MIIGTPRIDAHQHYWKLTWSGYPWMQPHKSIQRDYGPDNLMPLLTAAGIDGTVIRTIAFAPVTPETRKAGIAGDMFVVATPRQIWAINQVIRVTGPFDEFIRQANP